MSQDLLDIVDRYDRELDGASKATLDRIFAAYDVSYRRLIDQLRQSYPNLEASGAISTLVRQGAIASELGEALKFIKPENEAAYQQLGEQIIAESLRLGEQMAGDTLDYIGLQSAFTTVPVGAIRNQAERFRERLVNYSDTQATSISAVVEQGLIQGWGTRKTQGALQGLGVSFKSSAETVARTEVMSAYNGAAKSRYEQSGVAFAIYIATPSERLCSVCAARNGLVYKIKDLPGIPSHPRCRCSSAPYNDLSEIDTEFWQKYRQEGLDELAEKGLKADAGPTYWEKKAGLTAAPKPAWTPGDKVPQVRAKANSLPLHQQLINRGKDTFSGQVAAIESAYATAPNESALKAAKSEVGKLEQQYRKVAESPDVDFLKLEALAKQIFNATDALRSIEGARENAVKDSFRSFKDSLGQGSDSKATEDNVSAVSIPRKSKNNPYEKQDYAAILSDLYAATNNQVTTLEKLYYKEPRAFAAQPGIRYKGEANDTTGRINVGRSSNLTYHTQVLWHEYGHHLEYSNPEFARAASEWIKSKATSDTPQKLRNLIPGSGYGNSEVAYPDKFIDPYVGKYYKNGTTEVVSMGLEHLASPALMQKLYEADPDHFFLILGMLR